MTFSRHAASLLTGLLLLAAGTRAQTPLGKPTLDEQKVQVWCATARFVYEDTGRPNLKNSLQCGGSLKAFENSIKPDSQRVYSALYQPLEARGTMYKGLGSDPSRLQKLTTEIINRLKSSPTRRANPARMQRLATLETALTNYVQNGTPIGNLAAAEAAAPDATDTAALDEGAPEAIGDAGLSEAGVATPQAAANSGAGESLMNKFFGPLALILSLLSLVLYALMRKSIGDFQKEISARIDRRREEISALQSTPAAGGSVKAADRLTPAQLREVEKLVQQRVEQELKKRSGRQVPPSEVAGSQPVQPPQASRPASAATLAAQPLPPVEQQPVAPQAAAVYSAPAQPAQIPALPPVAPAGPSPAPAHDEFDSLVPPVQLPAPEPYVTPQPISHARYVKVPVNGAFNEYDLSDEPQHDSIYEIYLNPQQPETATFRVTSNPAVHAYAIQSAQYSLREACVYQPPSGPVSHIVTEQEGILRKVAGNWHIEQKAAIRFE